MTSLLQALIRFYQLTFAALLGGHCRYQPSCSTYAAQALQVHGAWKGSLLAFLRVCRCGPGGGHGFDPVPVLWQDALPRWLKF